MKYCNCDNPWKCGYGPYHCANCGGKDREAIKANIKVRKELRAKERIT